MGTLDTGLNSYHYGFIALFHHQTFTMSGISLILLFCSKGIWHPSTTLCVKCVMIWSGRRGVRCQRSSRSWLTQCVQILRARYKDAPTSGWEIVSSILPSASHDLPVPSAIITWIVFCSFLDIFETEHQDWAIFKSVELHKTDVGLELKSLFLNGEYHWRGWHLKRMILELEVTTRIRKILLSSVKTVPHHWPSFLKSLHLFVMEGVRNKPSCMHLLDWNHFPQL